MTTTTSSALDRPWEYSAFPVTVQRSRQISPGFRRITLGGEALHHFADWGLDQRIKLVLPMPDGSRPDFGLLADPTPHPSHWYARWKELPEDGRNALRTYTYTPAAIRPTAGEIDVDVFLHEPAGPASAWALNCAPGDSSALPAMRNILSALSAGTPADVFLELADPADNTLDEPDVDTRVHVVQQDAASVAGRALECAVREWGAAKRRRSGRSPRRLRVDRGGGGRYHTNPPLPHLRPRPTQGPGRVSRLLEARRPTDRLAQVVDVSGTSRRRASQ